MADRLKTSPAATGLRRTSGLGFGPALNDNVPLMSTKSGTVAGHEGDTVRVAITQAVSPRKAPAATAAFTAREFRRTFEKNASGALIDDESSGDENLASNRLFQTPAQEGEKKSRKVAPETKDTVVPEVLLPTALGKPAVMASAPKDSKGTKMLLGVEAEEKVKKTASSLSVQMKLTSKAAPVSSITAPRSPRSPRSPRAVAARFEDQDQDFTALVGTKVLEKFSAIIKAEERGIQVLQLNELLFYIEGRASQEGVIESWTDPDAENGKIYLKSLDLYQVITWLINPLTQRHKCSYVEAIAKNAKSQIPSWFASHWWGISLQLMSRCIEKHNQARDSNPSSSYWIAGFANSNDTGQDVLQDPLDCSVLKAMSRCDGVLLIIDPAGKVFQRTWCLFEMAVVPMAARELLEDGSRKMGAAFLPSLVHILARDGMDGRRKPLYLDLAANAVIGGTNSDFAAIVTDGLTNEELLMEKQNPGSGQKAKTERENSFPTRILEAGLKAEIRTSAASRDSDKRRLLNALTGQSHGKFLQRAPDMDHKNLDLADRIVRSTFALAGWRQAAQKGMDSDKFELAIRKDTTRREFKLIVGNCITMPQFSRLSACMRPIRKLRLIDISMTGCANISTVAPLGFDIKKLRKVRKLSLDLSQCVLTNIAELCIGMSMVPSLTILNLNLSGCAKFRTLAELGRALACLKRLSNISLNFEGCKGLTISSSLGEGLGTLQACRHLRLNFKDCVKLDSMSHVGRGIGKMRDLESLDLDFSGCKAIESLDELGRSLRRMRGLAHLRLVLQDCESLQSGRQLARGIAHVGICLQDFTFKLNGCKSLRGLAELTAVLEILSKQKKSKAADFVKNLRETLKVVELLERANPPEEPTFMQKVRMFFASATRCTRRTADADSTRI